MHEPISRNPSAPAERATPGKNSTTARAPAPGKSVRTVYRKGTGGIGSATAGAAVDAAARNSYFHLIATPKPGDDALYMEYAHPDGGTVTLPVAHAVYRQLLWDMDAPGYTGPRLHDVVEDRVVDYRVALFAGAAMSAGGQSPGAAADGQA